MEFCYTLPLRRRLNRKPSTSQTVTAPFFCWDVHTLTVQRRKAVLAMNCASRYSLLLYGMNGADWVRLPELVRDEIRAVILREGLSEFEATRYFVLGGPLSISAAHGLKSTAAHIINGEVYHAKKSRGVLPDGISASVRSRMEGFFDDFQHAVFSR